MIRTSLVCRSEGIQSLVDGSREMCIWSPTGMHESTYCPDSGYFAEQSVFSLAYDKVFIEASVTWPTKYSEACERFGPVPAPGSHRTEECPLRLAALP